MSSKVKSSKSEDVSVVNSSRALKLSSSTIGVDATSSTLLSSKVKSSKFEDVSVANSSRALKFSSLIIEMSVSSKSILGSSKSNPSSEKDALFKLSSAVNEIASSLSTALPCSGNVKSKPSSNPSSSIDDVYSFKFDKLSSNSNSISFLSSSKGGVDKSTLLKSSSCLNA